MATFSTALLLTLCALLALVSGSCLWESHKLREYCYGDVNATFDQSRKFCQQFGADLVTLRDSQEYSELLEVLKSLPSLSLKDNPVDIFLGVYQAPCDPQWDSQWDTDRGVWRPYSSLWYWVNSSEPITMASSSYWKILDSPDQYISNPRSLSAQALNKQHYVIGSDGHFRAVDAFADETPHLTGLKPLCVRSHQKLATPKNVAADRQSSNSSTALKVLSMNTILMAVILLIVL